MLEKIAHKMTHFLGQKLCAHRELFYFILFFFSRSLSKDDDFFFIFFCFEFLKFASSPIETVAFWLHSRSIILIRFVVICLLHGKTNSWNSSWKSLVSFLVHSFIRLLVGKTYIHTLSFAYLRCSPLFSFCKACSSFFLHFVFRYNLFYFSACTHASCANKKLGLDDNVWSENKCRFYATAISKIFSKISLYSQEVEFVRLSPFANLFLRNTKKFNLFT